MREGWSVLVTGYAHEVHDVEQLQRLERLGVEPWSGDDRPFYVRIEPVEMSGRRIRTVSHDDASSPEPESGMSRRGRLERNHC